MNIFQQESLAYHPSSQVGEKNYEKSAFAQYPAPFDENKGREKGPPLISLAKCVPTHTHTHAFGDHFDRSPLNPSPRSPHKKRKAQHFAGLIGEVFIFSEFVKTSSIIVISLFDI